MHRLFLDANVLFTAAHNPDGKAAFLFDALDLKRWELLSSAFAIAEAQRNLAAKYPPCCARLESLVAGLTVVGQPAPVATGISLPEKDQPIYVAALACRATHLLTGDRQHFGRHMNRPQATGGIVIQSVAEYLAGC
ncbi:MAG: putative toxin-antitoxin system toxin component, PIN family [Steroidobacteraceae bacterium]